MGTVSGTDGGMLVEDKSYRLRTIVALCVCAGCATSALAQDIVPPKQFTVTPGGVSLSDGSFTFTDTDLSIGNLTLQRFHLGGLRDPNDPPFGPRMGHNFDIYISKNPRSECEENVKVCRRVYKPIIHMGLSASGMFYETMPPYAIIQNNNRDSSSGDLEYNASGAYVYTDAQGAIYTFSKTITVAGAGEGRKVESIIFPTGNRRTFLYDSSSRLKSVVDSTGYALVFDYTGNFVSTVCGYNTSSKYIDINTTCRNATLKASYSYTGGSSSKLAAVTDSLGKTTSYTYDRNEISCVKPPSYSSCRITNTYGNSLYPWQVTQQTMLDASVWKFSYIGDYLNVRNPEQFAEVEPSTSTTVTDPLNKQSQYAFVQGSPYTAIDANGDVTQYRFEGGAPYGTPPDYSSAYGTLLMRATLPEGNVYTATYGLRNAIGSQIMQPKPGSNLPTLTTAYGYVANCDPPNTRQNCAKPIWKRDSKQNQTDYSYTSWGGLETEMLPAAAAGAFRPLKRYTYAQKYAYVLNAAGSLVPGASPIWMIQSETQCQTVAATAPAAVCDTNGPQTVTIYQYGADGTANNLLVKGVTISADGQTLRTCYGYDQTGNRISETRPRAGLAVCP